MRNILLAKFTQNVDLKEKLLGTLNKTLIECNPKDPYWGIGLSLGNPNIWVPARWKDENRLGKILSSVREEIRAQKDV